MRKVQKLAAIAALGATATLTLTTPAFAHDQLVSVTPEASSQLKTAPEEIVMEFSGDIMNVDGANQIKIVDAEGHSLADGDPKVDGKTVIQKLVSDDSENDTYTVTWRVVSSDGHPIQDSFEYTVGEGAQATSSASVESTSEASSQSVEDKPSGFTPANIAIFVAAAVLIVGAVATVALKTRRR